MTSDTPCSRIDPDRVILHVGLPKTGTTTLQFRVFPNIVSATYLGKPYDRPGVPWETNAAIAALVDEVWTRTESEYNHVKAAELLRRGLSDRVSQDGDRGTIILSEEALTQASGGDRLEKARRLRRLFGRCRVLMTIREQRDALFSGHRWLYARRLVEHGFERWIDNCRCSTHMFGGADDFPLRQFRYGELIRAYQRMFGQDRVTVIPMELMRADPAAFAGALAPMLDVDASTIAGLLEGGERENVSPGVLGVAYQRIVRRARTWRGRRASGDKDWEDPLALAELRQGMHGPIMNCLAKIDTRPAPPKPRTSQRLAEYYRQSNRLTAELTGWALGDLGYAI